MRVMRGVLLIVFTLGVAASRSSGQEPKPVSERPRPEPWQASWEKFVEIHNACIKDDGCDKKRFLDKSVRWEGRVTSIDLQKQPPSIVMEMAGPVLQDKTGAPSDWLVFVLNPDSAETAGWKALAKGHRVRFRTRTSGGITGSVVGYMSLPGRATVMFNCVGGELLERLPEAK